MTAHRAINEQIARCQLVRARPLEQRIAGASAGGRPSSHARATIRRVAAELGIDGRHDADAMTADAVTRTP